MVNEGLEGPHPACPANERTPCPSPQVDFAELKMITGSLITHEGSVLRIPPATAVAKPAGCLRSHRQNLVDRLTVVGSSEISGE